MFGPFEAFIGLRYVRAKRRNHFISFISLSSMVGVALGVMALITVLSVMNGFEKELTSRILGMASHASVISRDKSLDDWQSVASVLKQNPSIIGVAPYIQAEGMLVYGGNVSGTVITGILPEEEPKVSEVADKMVDGNFNDLVPGNFDIIIGTELGKSLGVSVGDKVTLVVPTANVTPAGIIPRMKRFNVVGMFQVGMHEYDSALAMIHIEDGKILFRDRVTTALRLKTDNIFNAPRTSREAVQQLPGMYWVVDWTQRHANFFRALKMEKTVMFIILTLIVAVAAFNIISTLVMVVTDKQSDIAVLRTIGVSPASIMKIFIIQGVIIGLVGILLGAIGGVWLASNVETIVPAIENFFQVKFLSPDVYYISELPSDMHWNDVIVISSVAFIFCLVATLYPAWRAARTQPAEALRYE